MAKLSALDALRLKKANLKKDISDIESIVKFDNPKQSIDYFAGNIKEKIFPKTANENGHLKALMDQPAAAAVADNLLKLGTVGLITTFAKNKMKADSWKDRLIGLAIVYITPILIKKLLQFIQSKKKNTENFS